MKLFLSALLLAAVPAVFAQNQPDPSQFGVAVAGMEGVHGQPAQAATDKLNAGGAAHLSPLLQTGCPLFIAAASVAAPAGYLPVAPRRPADGTLTLHFRDQSGKAIRSASITATVKVKTNIYDLDAHSVALQLTLSGTGDVNRDLDQLSRIELPPDDYVFGLAEVSLDSVTYADGTNWTNPKPDKYCGTNGQAVKTIDAK